MPCAKHRKTARRMRGGNMLDSVSEWVNQATYSIGQSAESANQYLEEVKNKGVQNVQQMIQGGSHSLRAGRSRRRHTGRRHSHRHTGRHRTVRRHTIRRHKNKRRGHK
jgi:hypothetical protein